ncbi:MAG: hypothetical protein ACFFD4_19985 [Candidatus Odinarchaeota archaeon]
MKPASSLDVSEVFLFSHGIGFLVRNGEIDGSSKTFNLAIQNKQLNDVLKSIIVFTSTGVITEMSYTSDYRDVDNFLDLSVENALTDIIENFQGNSIEIETFSGDKIIGRIVGIEELQKKHEEEEKLLVLYDQSGVFKQVSLNDVEKITLQDGKLQKDLENSLDAISFKKEDMKRLTFHYSPLNSTGSTEVTLGYATVLPIWKTTYRIVIPQEEPGDSSINIQSWSIVENSTKEHWDDILLTLISGKPISFIYDLNRSDFILRTDATPKTYDAVSPVTAPPALRKPSDKVGTARAGSAGELRGEMLTELRRLRAVFKEEEGEEETKEKAVSLSDLVTGSPEIDVTTLKLGEMFIYQVDHKITIKAEDKAVIPLVNSNVPGKKVLYYDPSKNQSPYPYNSIELTNKTGGPLESGPAMIFEGDTPAGEAILPPCFSDQEQLLSYSQEARVRVMIKAGPITYSKYSYKPSFDKNLFVQTNYQYQEVSFEVDNSLEDEKELIIDYSHAGGYEIIKKEVPEEVTLAKTEKGWRFRFPVKDESELVKIKYQKKIKTEIGFRSTSEELFNQLDVTGMPEEIVTSFKRQFELNRKISDLSTRITNLKNQRSVFNDQQMRIRENLLAISDHLDNEKKTRRFFVEKLNTIEDRLEELEKTLEEFEKDRTSLQEEVDALFKKEE